MNTPSTACGNEADKKGRPVGQLKTYCALAALLGLVACGGDETTNDGPSGTARASAAPNPQLDKFRALANDVCATVLQGSPPRLSPNAERGAIVRHARASIPGTRAIAESLRRLPAPEALESKVDALARAYRDLQRDYVTLEKASTPKAQRTRLVQAIREREVFIQARAAEAGLIACAGTPPR